MDPVHTTIVRVSISMTYTDCSPVCLPVLYLGWQVYTETTIKEELDDIIMAVQTGDVKSSTTILYHREKTTQVYCTCHIVYYLHTLL